MAIFTPWDPNFRQFQSEFSNKIFAFHFRLSKTYIINPYTRAIHFWKLETRYKNFIWKIWIELFKFNLVLTLQWQNESWYINRSHYASKLEGIFIEEAACRLSRSKVTRKPPLLAQRSSSFIFLSWKILHGDISS